MLISGFANKLSHVISFKVHQEIVQVTGCIKDIVGWCCRLASDSISFFFFNPEQELIVDHHLYYSCTVIQDSQSHSLGKSNISLTLYSLIYADLPL